MAEWQNGNRIAEWWNGGMVEWRNGGMAGMAEQQKEWPNSRMAEMATYVLFMVHTDDSINNRMAESQNGGMVIEWRSGEMVIELRNGGMVE